MPHQLFAAGLQARDIYSELKKTFLQKKLKCDMGRAFNNKTWSMD